MAAKEMSLADLGLEEQTPAEKAAADAEMAKYTEGKEIEEPEVKEVIQTESGAVESVVLQPVAPKEEKKKEKKEYLTPDGRTADGKTQYGEIITDVNKIAKTPMQEEGNPIRDTLDNFYNMADEGIERTKKEMLAEGGRIDEAKRKYIEETYEKLDRRARTNKSVADHIAAINHAIDTDARFDGISELERKGYILFTVAHDEKVGIDNKYFNIEDEELPRKPRLSSDVSKEVKSISDDTLSLDNEGSVSLGKNNTGKPVVPDISKAKVEDDDTLELDDEKEKPEDFLRDEDEKPEQEDTEDDDVQEQISEDQRKEIRHRFKEDLVQKLNLDKNNEIDGFTISTKPIKLIQALNVESNSAPSVIWPLMVTGVPIEMTAFMNDEIVVLNPQNTDFNKVSGLKKVFSIFYNHIINSNKPKFETWLHQVVDYDIDNLVFAGFAATFKDTNYLTYECTNPKCKNVYLEKKDIMDMVVFPNEDVKKRFNDIIAKDTVSSQVYETKPCKISDNFALGFVSQSIYSNLFEPASIPEDMAKKYSTIISIMPNIDKAYKINRTNRTLAPIVFGVDESLSKTTMKKIKALNTIFDTFSTDERAIAIAEAQKISQKYSENQLKYCIPESKCPVCGEVIEQKETNPLNILFTRAQLPIVAAYIPE